MPPYCEIHGRHHSSRECEYEIALDQAAARAAREKVDRDARIARATKLGLAAYATAHGVPVDDVNPTDLGLQETIDLMVAELATA
ncbi:hypothetical protein [Agromyces humi]|uniref:hypothetical protein n=1 Tax=Agromyces humi TaxID=1766800 RepID=UPI00135B35BB|nr:hypothetical protein [Agromyces humi]